MKLRLARLLALTLCFCAFVTLAACGEKAPSKTNDDITPPATEDTKEQSAEDKIPDEPTEPEKPVEPEQPTEPEQPVEPENPTEPEEEPENYDGLEPWQIAYLKFLDDDSKSNGTYHCDYSLVFVDSDNIPELFRSGPDSASGEIICSYRNDQLFTQHLRRTGGSKYIPSGSLVYNSQGIWGTYSTNVYRLTDDGFVNLFSAAEELYTYRTIDTDGERLTKSVRLYYLKRGEVTEEEFNAEVAKYFDLDKSESFFKNGPVVDVDYATIRQQIKDWDYSILPPEAPVLPEPPTEPETPTEPEQPTEPTQPEVFEAPAASKSSAALAGEIPQEVYDAIDAGDFETAYLILYYIENPSEKQKELLSHFLFLPKEVKNRFVRSSLHIYKFYENGNMKSDCYYLIDGSVVTHYYNEDGTLQTVTYYWDYGSWDDYTYIYDKKGNVVMEIVEDSQGGKGIIKYSYDENNNMTSMEMSREKRTYTYDENGNLLSELRQRDSGNNTLYTYTYDSEGKLLSKRSSSSYSVWVYTYTYDQNGNLLTEHINYTSSWRQINHTYDENGFLIKTETVDDGKIDETITYERDEKGRILSETTEENGNIDKKSFRYDKYGNKYSIGSSLVYELHYFPDSTPKTPDLPARTR